MRRAFALLVVFLAPAAWAARSRVLPEYRYGGTIAGEVVHLTFRPLSDRLPELLGASWRPARREVRLLKGTLLHDGRVRLDELAGPNQQTATITGRCDRGRFRGVWTEQRSGEKSSFAFSPIDGGASEFLGSSPTRDPIFDAMHAAVRAGRFDEAAYHARILCGVHVRVEYCSYPAIFEAEQRGERVAFLTVSVPSTLHAYLVERSGDRANATRLYRTQCGSYSERFACHMLLDVVPTEERKDAAHMACSSQAIACAEAWGNDSVALIEAARRGDVQSAGQLLDTNVNVNAGAGALESPLQAAVPTGCLEMVRLLLDHGADPNFLSETRSNFPSPLMSAIRRHDQTMAVLLLERGADPLFIRYSDTPLEEAACDRQTSIVLAILSTITDAAADWRLPSALDASLRCAVYFDDVEMARDLLAHGANPDQTFKFEEGTAREDATRSRLPAMRQLLADAPEQSH